MYSLSCNHRVDAHEVGEFHYRLLHAIYYCLRSHALKRKYNLIDVKYYRGSLYI